MTQSGPLLDGVSGLSHSDARVWRLSLVELAVAVGLVIKSTYLASRILGAGGLMAGIPIAIWLVATFWIVARLGKGIQKGSLLALMVILNAILYADLLHIRAFGTTIDLLSVASAPTSEGLAPSILALMSPWDLFFFTEVVVIILIYGVFGQDKPITLKAPRRRISYLFSTFLVGYMIFATIIATRVPLSPHQYLAGSGPLGVHANQLLSALPWSQHTLSEKERLAIDSWFERNSQYAEAGAEYERLFGVLGGRDVYLIVVESLEGVIVNLEVEGQEVTPYINSILDESIVFPDVVEQVRDGVTSDAELILLTGMYPLQSGSAFLKASDSTFPIALPRILGAKGYSTAAVNGDAKQFWNRHVMFPKLGIETYVAEEEFVSVPQIGMGVADEALFAQAHVEREKLSTPTFMMLSTITSHFPWSIPAEQKGLVLKHEDRTAGYLQTLNYVDRSIGTFINAVEARDPLSKPAFIIVGDHEGIHKFDGDDTWLHDNNSRIPFIVHVPGLKGEVVSTRGGQVDILPTLTYMLGVEPLAISGRVMGRNLLGSHPGSAITSEGLMTDGVSPDDLLEDAFYISDLAIRGNYFGFTENEANNG